MTPAALADRIAALDWSCVSLQHQLAVTAAMETLRNPATLGGSEDESVQHTDAGVAAVALGSVHRRNNNGADNSMGSVVPFPAFRAPSTELLRGTEYNERRVTLRCLDGSTAATTLVARSERWDWIVSTVCELCQCDPEQVAMDDDTVTVRGEPVFSC